jgi:hypothetical protein
MIENGGLKMSDMWKTNAVAVAMIATLYSLGANLLTWGMQVAGLIPEMPALSGLDFFMNWILGYCVGCFVGILLPGVFLIKWGMGTAKAVGFKFDKPKRFHKAVQTVYAFWFCVFVSGLMTFITTWFKPVFMYHATASGYITGSDLFFIALKGWGTGFIPNLIIVYIVTFLFLDFVEGTAKNILGIKDEWGGGGQGGDQAAASGDWQK